MHFTDRPIAITDLETSGDVFGVHEILEIGLVLVEPKTLEILDTLNVKVKPERIENAVPAALAKNGYTAESWKEAITLKEAVTQYATKTKDAVFYAYNVSFDWGFMNDAFRQTGVRNEMDYHRFDLMSMAYLLHRDKLRSVSFDAISDVYGIPREPLPHTALAGAMQAYYLLQKIYA